MIGLYFFAVAFSEWIELHTDPTVSHADMWTMCVSSMCSFIINDNLSPTWILIKCHKLPESDLITNKSLISSASVGVCAEAVH